MHSEPSPWRLQARNAFDQLFLHDCVISSFALEDSDLVLSLDEGFQALAGTACNPAAAKPSAQARPGCASAA